VSIKKNIIDNPNLWVKSICHNILTIKQALKLDKWTSFFTKSLSIFTNYSLCNVWSIIFMIFVHSIFQMCHITRVCISVKKKFEYCNRGFSLVNYLTIIPKVENRSYCIYSKQNTPEILKQLPVRQSQLIISVYKKKYYW
jgi:hypothetical protein